MKRCVVICGLLIACLLSGLSAAEAPSADKLIDQARRNFSSLNDYSVDIRLDLKSNDINIKGMLMTMYYKKPDKTRIVAKQGFSALPRDVALGNVINEITKNSKPKLIKSAKESGVDCYVIQLDPIREGSRPATTVWLDKSKLLVRATKLDGPFPVETNWKYTRVDKKYYLPSRIDAQITGPSRRGDKQTVHATLRFSHYRVNKGIKDSVFTTKNPPK